LPTISYFRTAFIKEGSDSMLFDRLAFIFEVMVYVGLGLPLVNLLFGFFSNLGHSSADLDGDVSGNADFLHPPNHPEAPSDIPIADVQIGAVHMSDLPVSNPHLSGAEAVNLDPHNGFSVRFNTYCLCLALVVQGTVGIFATTNLDGMTRILVLGGGFCFAVTAYILFYRIVIHTLKKNNAEALRTQNLTFRRAYVSFRILPDSPGKIQTFDQVGAIISFLAELDPDICKVERIDEGEEVIITSFVKEQNLCYVTLPIITSRMPPDE
jgi:hypothetical protein